MRSDSGRFVIAFNGEIYNFIEIRGRTHRRRRRIPGRVRHRSAARRHRAMGHRRDVEARGRHVRLRPLGPPERVLRLARDRMGEKPLYYGWSGSTLLFGSELKALRAHPSFAPRSTATRWRSISGTATCRVHGRSMLGFRNCRRPRSRPSPQAGPIAIEPYWSVNETATSGLLHPFRGGDVDATRQLDAVLRGSVQGQMVADVPVGAFLSGGIDPSALVALMQAQSNRPVKTFTIGFGEREFENRPTRRQSPRIWEPITRNSPFRRTTHST